MTEIDAVLELLTAGTDAVYSRDGLAAKLAKGRPLRVKLGMDPTAPDLHLGHSVVLRKLRAFQDLGHVGVLIVGDTTARIGDPTGRDSTRPILSAEEVADNARTYLDQAGTVLDTSPGKLEVRHNSEWLAGLALADVLRLTGAVTLQQMNQRRSFKQRIAKGQEVRLSECLYPLMQAFDSVAVEADVELGGTDQTFNNLLGRDLMAQHGLVSQVVLTMPLLVGLDGVEKMSKSKGNTVGVTEPPDAMFGKLMSISDALMPDYFRLLTDLSSEQVAALTDPARAHPREAKDRLAREVVTRFHGADRAEAASVDFRARFRDGALPTDLETCAVPSPIGAAELVRTVGFASSSSEARRLIAQGGVRLDDRKLTDPKQRVNVEAGAILRVGKRRVCRLEPG